MPLIIRVQKRLTLRIAGLFAILSGLAAGLISCNQKVAVSPLLPTDVATPTPSPTATVAPSPTQAVPAYTPVPPTCYMPIVVPFPAETATPEVTPMPIGKAPQTRLMMAKSLLEQGLIGEELYARLSKTIARG
jgi:hypothetical protein